MGRKPSTNRRPQTGKDTATARQRAQVQAVQDLRRSSAAEAHVDRTKYDRKRSGRVARQDWGY